MGMITINGMELEFDLFDADIMEKYEDANHTVIAEMKDNSMYAGKSTAESMRAQCRVVDEFFETVFGPGTAQQIFEKSGNLMERIEAFGIVAEEAQKCGQEIRSLTSKYSVNREQRRQLNKNEKEEAWSQHWKS